jgi:hypothetical protein
VRSGWLHDLIDPAYVLVSSSREKPWRSARPSPLSFTRHHEPDRIMARTRLRFRWNARYARTRVLLEHSKTLASGARWRRVLRDSKACRRLAGLAPRRTAGWARGADVGESVSYSLHLVRLLGFTVFGGDRTNRPKQYIIFILCPAGRCEKALTENDPVCLVE